VRRGLIVIAVLLSISIVVLWQTSKGKENQTLQGIYLMAFERSDFYPNVEVCPPSGTRYWLDPASIPNLRAQLATLTVDQAHALAYQAVYLRFVGDISNRGQYGHLGQYWREVQVKRILEIKKIDSCQ